MSTANASAQGGSSHVVANTQNTLNGLPPFVHADLQPKFIRIFELLPGSHGAPIEGTIQHIEMTSIYHPYLALSYAWGNTTRNEIIACNGCALGVTTNLLRTLTRLRRPDASLTIWVDAICINQDTNPPALRERAQQVALIGQIFSNAWQVIIDLGDSGQDFDHLLEYLELYTLRDPSEVSLIVTGDISLPGSAQLDISDLQLWEEFLLFMQLPWFQRLWCFQEYVLARKMVNLVGSRLITHFNLHLGFVRAITRFETCVSQVDTTSLTSKMGFLDAEGFKKQSNLIMRRAMARISQSLNMDSNIEPLLTASRFLKVTDPRDKIYAIYALLPSGIRNELKVDYQESFDSLELRVSLLLIEKDYGTWVLMFPIGPNHLRPSWLLSLSPENQGHSKQSRIVDCSHTAGNPVPVDDTIKVYFKAGGSVPPKITPDAQLKTIVLDGYICESIGAMSDKFLPTKPGDPQNALNMVYDQLESLWTWAEQTQIDEEILWRCLILDGYGELRSMGSHFREQSVRDPAFRKSYHELKQVVETRHDSDFKPSLAGALFLQQISICMTNMRVAVTMTTADEDECLVAVVPNETEIGDKIVVFVGVPAPFVLRETGSNYQIVGPCYLHGYMDGQALDHERWSCKSLTIV